MCYVQISSADTIFFVYHEIKSKEEVKGKLVYRMLQKKKIMDKRMYHQ